MTRGLYNTKSGERQSKDILYKTEDQIDSSAGAWLSSGSRLPRRRGPGVPVAAVSRRAIQMPKPMSLDAGESSMKAPVRVAVTGAAGQIGYSLLFRIAAGEMLGADQPVILQLLEIPHEKAQKALKGVMMELEDCAFPLLAGMQATDDAKTAFRDADVALLVGARPRGPGMERKDLLMENAKIFIEQGRALDAAAKRQVRVLVVGNPANTNAYIAMKLAPGLDPRNFTAMMRLDHNRAVSQLAQKLSRPVTEIRKV